MRVCRRLRLLCLFCLLRLLRLLRLLCLLCLLRLLCLLCFLHRLASRVQQGWAWWLVQPGRPQIAGQARLFITSVSQGITGAITREAKKSQEIFDFSLARAQTTIYYPLLRARLSFTGLRMWLLKKGQNSCSNVVDRDAQSRYYYPSRLEQPTENKRRAIIRFEPLFSSNSV